jgi:hypothetical protein
MGDIEFANIETNSWCTGEKAPCLSAVLDSFLGTKATRFGEGILALKRGGFERAIWQIAPQINFVAFDFYL